jgi:hypothetical protein
MGDFNRVHPMPASSADVPDDLELDWSFLVPNTPTVRTLTTPPRQRPRQF